MSRRCSPQDIPAHIFRAYDIRGVVETELTPDVVHDIAMVYGEQVQLAGRNKVILARDARLSGPKLFTAFASGLHDVGCDVIDIGVVPTPLLYFATHHLDTDCGVMITGSHNPPQYNGLKMILAGVSVSGERVQSLYQQLQRDDLYSGTGTTEYQDVRPNYFRRVISETQSFPTSLKVVVDAGNGVTGDIAPDLLRQLGCEVTELYCEVDGSFPNHHPDPSKPENLQDLIAKVQAVQADIGLAFDGDGDRLGVITPQGKMIYPDRQLMLFARDILLRNGGGKVVYDVKCSKFLAEVVRQAGGEPIMYKTGHSLIKAKLKESGAVIGGEMSGHIFFNDHWYGFDDALYTAVRLLSLMVSDGRDVDTIFAEIPEAVSTPELNVAVPDASKFALMQALQQDADFPGANVVTIDGLRVEFADGWGLIRPSNTTPNFVLRFEADDADALWRIQILLRDFLLEHDPGLDVPLHKG